MNSRNSKRITEWIDSSTVLLYAHRSAKFEIKNETEKVGVSFFFTRKFDLAGHWKVTHGSARWREKESAGSTRSSKKKPVG
jgi:hypothetical protein